MSSLVSTPSCRSLPSIPLEIQHEILRQCDPSTLARTSRVSLAFLELSSPLLYGDITIGSVEKLYELFRKRDDTHQPHLSPHLSLTQIRTLHLVFTVFDEICPPDLGVQEFLDLLSSSRFDGSQTLPIKDVRITFDNLNRYLLLDIYSSFLPLLNPLHSSWNILGCPPDTESCLLDLDEPGGLTGWTRLETLNLYGMIPYSWGSWDGTEDSSLPAGLPFLGLLPPQERRRRVIRIDFASLGVPVSRLAATMESLECSPAFFGPEPTRDGSLVLVVGSEKERTELEEVIRMDLELRRWRRVLAVEVVVGGLCIL